MEERWLATSTVALMLDRHPRTVVKMIKAGKFRYVRDVGAGEQPRYQIKRESVEEFKQRVLVDYGDAP